MIEKWKKFTKKLRTTPGRDLLASCFAKQVTKYDPTAIPLGEGQTDARVSGFLAMYAITGDNAYLSSAFTTVLQLSTGVLTPHFLQVTIERIDGGGGGSGSGDSYWRHHWSLSEMSAAVVSLVVMAVGYLIGYAAGKWLKSAIEGAVVKRSQIVATIALALINVVLGVTPWNVFITEQSGNINKIIWTALDSLTWYEWLVLTGLAAVSAIADAFGKKAIQTVLLAVDFGLFILAVRTDYNDYDTSPDDLSDVIDYYF